MKKFFTLTDLIITIVIIGILAVIVLLNINNLNEKAKITSLNADKRSIQLAVDKYSLDKGICPSVIQPTLGNPQSINFKELYSDYIKSMPQNKDAYYWVDVNCLVYISLIDAPTDVTVDIPKGIVTWTPHKDSSKSIIYIKRPDGSIKIVEEDKTGNYDGEDGKEHLVSEEDKHGLETPPVGKDYIGYPKPSEENDKVEGPIVPCDTDGFICIYTAEELASIGVDPNYPLIENYRLANDIDLIVYENWTPIYDDENWEFFSGIFDGNGFAINNLTILDNKGKDGGLFSRTYDSHIMNLTLNDVSIESSSSNSSLGSIAAESYHTIFENISVNGTVKGGYEIGGIIAEGEYLEMNNIRFQGDVISNYYAGGIIAEVYNLIGKNIENHGTVKGNGYAGGIIGNGDYVELENTKFNGVVEGSGYYSGGIVGDSYYLIGTNLEIYGTISGENYVGGTIGNGRYIQIKDVIFRGEVKGTNYYAGGIIGEVVNLKGTNISAYGSVEGNMYTGGIFGWANAAVISNLYSQANVIGTGQYSGGAVGYTYDSTYENIHFKGDVSGTSNVGGLLGFSTTVKLNISSVVGNVDAKGRYVGGLAGYTASLYVTDSFVEGKLNNNDLYTGGLVGYESDGRYNRVYSKMSVEGINDALANALFGYAYIHINNGEQFKDLYWSSEASKQQYSSTYGINSQLPSGNVGISEGRADSSNQISGQHLSIEEMKNKENYKNWDFNYIWEYKGVVPILRNGIDSSEEYWFKNCDNIFEGNGTENSPYKIKTYKDFKNIEFCSNKYFKLENDLNIIGIEHEPLVAFKWDSFSGVTIEGNNKTITATNLGEPLFTSLNDFTIKNLKFKDITMEATDIYNGGHILSSGSSGLIMDNVIFENIHISAGTNSVAIISDYCSECSISNITVKDSSVKTSVKEIYGTQPATAGGLMVSVDSGNFKNISFINVSIEGGYITGGIVGSTNYDDRRRPASIFENISLTNVKVKGNNTYTGGIIGHGETFELKKVRGDVNVQGTSRVGGIVGVSYEANISDIIMDDSPKNIEVNGDNIVGGITGDIYYSSLEEISITGDISGRVSTGGIYGSRYGTIKNNILFNGKLNGITTIYQ